MIRHADGGIKGNQARLIGLPVAGSKKALLKPSHPERKLRARQRLIATTEDELLPPVGQTVELRVGRNNAHEADDVPFLGLDDTVKPGTGTDDIPDSLIIQQRRFLEVESFDEGVGSGLKIIGSFEPVFLKNSDAAVARRYA